MTNSEKERNSLLNEAVNAAIHWVRTDTCYFSMRDKVEAFFQASTLGNESRLWYDYSDRKLAMHDLMFKCITPLTPSQYQKLDHEVRDIAATLPENAVRHLHR